MRNYKFQQLFFRDRRPENKTLTHQIHTFKHFSPPFTHLFHIPLFPVVPLILKSGLPDDVTGIINCLTDFKSENNDTLNYHR